MEERTSAGSDEGLSADEEAKEEERDVLSVEERAGEREREREGALACTGCLRAESGRMSARQAKRRALSIGRARTR